MTEKEFLIYCQNQVQGPLTDDDLVLMLTAWGQIQYQLGYNTASDKLGTGENNKRKSDLN